MTVTVSSPFSLFALSFPSTRIFQPSETAPFFPNVWTVLTTVSLAMPTDTNTPLFRLSRFERPYPIHRLSTFRLPPFPLQQATPPLLPLPSSPPSLCTSPPPLLASSSSSVILSPPFSPHRSPTIAAKSSRGVACGGVRLGRGRGRSGRRGTAVVLSFRSRFSSERAVFVTTEVIGLLADSRALSVRVRSTAASRVGLRRVVLDG